jgi:hypothetical protein
MTKTILWCAMISPICEADPEKKMLGNILHINVKNKMPQQ